MNAMQHVVNEYKEDIYQFISDVSKEATGVRTRVDIRLYGVGELNELADFWSKQADMAYEQAQEEQRMDIKAFEDRIDRAFAMGCQSRAQAISWIRQAEGTADRQDGMGDSYLEYTLGLPYGYITE